jgi:hypothetical protein
MVDFGRKLQGCKKKKSIVFFSVYEEPWKKGREQEGRRAWTGHMRALSTNNN